MKKFVVCAITLALVMSFAGCQKQPVENGSTVSARGPMVSEGTSSVELTSQDENSDDSHLAIWLNALQAFRIGI